VLSDLLSSLSPSLSRIDVREDERERKSEFYVKAYRQIIILRQSYVEAREEALLISLEVENAEISEKKRRESKKFWYRTRA
jgi:hypothetical protein